MSLRKKDKQFRLKKISYLDFKQIEMDRVLTSFFARLQHDGYPSRLTRQKQLKIEAFREEFTGHPQWFRGFGRYPEITEAWIETHLMDVVNRGKPNQAVAAPRPLHGYTYRFRNTRHSRDYGAAQQLYEMLYHSSHSALVLEQLELFFFAGIDPATETYDNDVLVDVETQALLRLTDQVQSDAPDRGKRDVYKPLLSDACDLLAKDTIRLLAYREHIPRSVMVEYLKILFALHLSLYHLRLIRWLPKQTGEATPGASEIGIFADMTGGNGDEVVAMAERSADIHYRRLPEFIRAYFIVRKLDEFASNLSKRGTLGSSQNGSYYTVSELTDLLGPEYRKDRDRFFGMRLDSLIEASSSDGTRDPEIEQILELDLNDFESYIECIVAHRGSFHKRYLTECLDSLLLKNKDGALLSQPKARNSNRRFVVESRLLEVLLQLAVLEQGASGLRTQELRVDELLEWIRDRYGIHVDELPDQDGFGDPSVTERKALQKNEQAFRRRLREIGFFRDLSDAYITQTVSPRYEITRS